ncbi:DUF4436 family protein [Terriglobus sp. TAA 43]|uniref:DUF4436 family protein n=1 Tax=Terriglobus sp. TAA 43 TaxID=278961 RepID=UPI000646D164|nr:DUF4436 family protein [Terriglobus sp. TAA 43]
MSKNNPTSPGPKIEKAHRYWISRTTRAIVLLALGALYLLSLWSSHTEESRRSITLTEAASSEDYVQMDVHVTDIDPVKALLYERIRLIPRGKFAIDRNRPAQDLTLLLNSVTGQQTIRFPKGERIEPIDAAVSLVGDSNKYPFDVYHADLDVLVSEKAARAPVKIPFGGPDVLSDPIEPGGLVVSAGDLEKDIPVPVLERVSASIPQFKFKGSITHDDADKLTRTEISARRANNVIFSSLVIMITMMGLAVSITAMAIKATRPGMQFDLLPLSLSISLIFGLPALRNTQPGVPGVGVLGDYVSFIWASLLVALSAIALAWTWIFKTPQQHEAGKDRHATDEAVESRDGDT